MTLPDIPIVNLAYEAAVVAFLNASPQSTEEEAEEFVDAMAELIFTTIYAFQEKDNDSTDH